MLRPEDHHATQTTSAEVDTVPVLDVTTLTQALSQVTAADLSAASQSDDDDSASVDSAITLGDWREHRNAILIRGRREADIVRGVQSMAATDVRAYEHLTANGLGDCATRYYEPNHLHVKPAGVGGGDPG